LLSLPILTELWRCVELQLQKNHDAEPIGGGKLISKVHYPAEWSGRRAYHLHTCFQHGAARAAEIAVRDIAEWFVPIGAEGLLPGTKNRDQSVLG
jgi:hypothetical protein